MWRHKKAEDDFGAYTLPYIKGQSARCLTNSCINHPIYVYMFTQTMGVGGILRLLLAVLFRLLLAATHMQAGKANEYSERQSHQHADDENVSLVSINVAIVNAALKFLGTHRHMETCQDTSEYLEVETVSSVMYL